MPIETGSYDRPAYRRRMNMEHRLVTLCCISGYRDEPIHPVQRMNMIVIQRKSFAAAIGMGIARYLSDVVSTFQSFPPPLIRWNRFQRFFFGVANDRNDRSCRLPGRALRDGLQRVFQFFPGG